MQLLSPRACLTAVLLAHRFLLVHGCAVDTRVPVVKSGQAMQKQLELTGVIFVDLYMLVNLENPLNFLIICMLFENQKLFY